MFKIATWNVNSIRSRINHLEQWLKEAQPDIVLLQELKCTEENCPIEHIEDMGYNIALSGQKSYNGVAILSKLPIEDVTTIFSESPQQDEARYIEAVISVNNKAIRVASIYVPNGQAVGSEKFHYKLDFYDKFYKYALKLLANEEITILGADYNVAPFDIDVYDPKSLYGTTCFTEEEKKRFRKFLNAGYVDAYRSLNPNEHDYSWWDYRAGSWEYNKGMRIDHLLLSPEAADLAQNCYTDKKPRSLDKPSDHAPVVVELKL